MHSLSRHPQTPFVSLYSSRASFASQWLTSPASSHKHGHVHNRRANYDVSNVDWSKIDWGAVFGNVSAGTAGQILHDLTETGQVSYPSCNGYDHLGSGSTTGDCSSRYHRSSRSANISCGHVGEIERVCGCLLTIPYRTSASTSTSAPVSSGTSGKKGIAWDQGTDASLASLFETGKASWIYNWGTSASFASSMQYMPMIKSASDVGALSSLPAGATVLGFNEPEMQGLSASEAASLYRNQITPLRKSGAIGKLISPAVTNGGNGLPWLQEFMNDCSDCEIDALAVHWYGPTMAMLESQMAAIHAAFPSMKLLVTEVACTNWNPATNPSAAQVDQFMTDASAWFESTDYIQSYAFFAAMPITDASLGTANSMLSGASAGSSLTALGSKYVS